MSGAAAAHASVWQNRLRLYLRLVGSVSLLAFAAALMPPSGFLEISDQLGLTFPNAPLTFYLARNLSALYGFVGCSLLILSADLPRYLPLVRYAAYGTLLLAALQGIMDHASEMPLWWTAGEALSTLAGGLLLAWLYGKAAAEAAQLNSTQRRQR